MQLFFGFKCAIPLVIALSCSPLVVADSAKLQINVSGGNHAVIPGDVVTLTLRMLDLGGEEAAGFQAFLEYDQQHLLFLSGSYTSQPFGLPVITPIEAVDGEIDLAAGINLFDGQQPTSADATLAVLTFVAEKSMDCVSTVIFRDADPPSRITDAEGLPIDPLELSGLPEKPPNADLNGDGVVDVFDLIDLINQWGPCDNPSYCPADLNCDGTVNVFDLIILINDWG